MMIAVALAAALAQDTFDEDLCRARERLAELARIIEAQRGEVAAARAAAQAFARGRCIACANTHAECAARETCEPACEAHLAKLLDAHTAAKKKLGDGESERRTLKLAWSRKLGELELDLQRRHDRIAMLLDVRKRLQELGDGLRREESAWRDARVAALADALDHLKVALRDRFKVLSKAKGEPGVQVEAAWRAFDKAREAWKALAAASDAASRADAFQKAIDGVQALRQAVLDVSAAMVPSASKELQLVAYTLGALVDGVQAIAVWEREGWAKAAPLVRKALDSVRGAVTAASGHYKPLALGLTIEELAEDAAGAALAHRALGAFEWALEINEEHQADVQGRLAELGRGYEAGDARRKRIREMLR